MDRFKLLESFVAVASTSSYSAAARQLGVSRALMSKRIMALEARLGARLFNRNTHRLSLTEAGLSYLTSCRSVLSELEAAEASLIERRKVPRGRLRILAPQSFACIHMGAAATDFMRRYREIDLFVTARELGGRTVDLVAGGFDLLLRTQPMADSSLVMRKIVPLEWFVVGSPAYLAMQGTPKTPEDLGEHRCLVTAYQRSGSWDLAGGGRPGEIKIPALAVSNLTPVTRQAALAGHGLALLPEYSIAADLAAGRLVRVLPAYRGKQRWLLAVYPSDRNAPLTTRLFIDFMVERFRDRPWAELLAEAESGPSAAAFEPLYPRRPAAV